LASRHAFDLNLVFFRNVAYARHFLFTSVCECALRASATRACRHCRERSLLTLSALGFSNERRMFESAHCMNSRAIFVLSTGSRLLSQREPQSLPVDALSFVEPVFHSPLLSISSFFLSYICVNAKIFKHLIQI